jgi:hypothetical protein
VLFVQLDAVPVPVEQVKVKMGGCVERYEQGAWALPIGKRGVRVGIGVRINSIPGLFCHIGPGGLACLYILRGLPLVIWTRV